MWKSSLIPNYLILSLLFKIWGGVSYANESFCYYSLPYQIDSTHRTLQGFHGNFSHQKPLQFAVDFEMSKGTKVLAARGGRVIKAKSDSNKSGKDKSFLKMANIIKIQHSDQTIGYYAHLKHQGVLVKEGQHVKIGEHIGYSGCTGFCDGPHLHFEVHKAANNKYKRETVPFVFWSKKGKVENIGRQESYTSAKNPIPCL